MFNAFALLILSFLFYPKQATKTNHFLSSIDVKQFTNDWPPLRIYFYELPDRYNNDILKGFNPLKMSSSTSSYQFVMEMLFPMFLKKSPLLTSNLEHADLVYFHYYPSYDLLNTKYHRQKNKCETDGFLDILKNSNVPEHKRLFIHIWPTYFWHSCLVVNENVFFGCYERRLNRPKEFVIPYVSNFSQLSAEEFRQGNFKKSISIFMGGSPIGLRKNISEIVKTIPNSKVVTAKRFGKEFQDFIHDVPFYYANSTFTIVARGDSPSSKRLYDAILYDCIPIIISDHFHLPYDGTLLNWSEFSVRIREKDYKTLPEVINSFTPEKIESFRSKLRIASERFRFDNGVKGSNGVGAIFWDLYLRYFYKAANRSKNPNDKSYTHHFTF